MARPTDSSLPAGPVLLAGGAGLTADRLAALAALVLFVVLALFGQRWHWVEEAGTAERDGYAAQAEVLLSGSLPHDPYRPLLYPLLTASLTPLTGDAFTAARLLSNLAAAALAWLAYLQGRALGTSLGRGDGGRRAGGWAMALLAVNPNLWILGQHATTDMLFAALAAASLLAALRYLRTAAPLAALMAGGLLGLAAFTRSNAVFLLPALLLAWWLAPVTTDPATPSNAASTGPSAPPGPSALAAPSELTAATGPSALVAPSELIAPTAPAAAIEAAARAAPSAPPVATRGRRLAHLGLAAVAAVVVLLPHWALRQIEFGNPFYDENWKNLAFKLFGYPDWSYLDRVPFRSLQEVVVRYPLAIARGGLAELWRFATAGAAQLLGTWPHLLLVVAGTLASLRMRPTRRSAAWLVVALGSFLAATAFAFFTWGRFLLLLLPGAYALAFTPWGGAVPPAATAWQWQRSPRSQRSPRWQRLQRWRRPLGSVLALGMVLLLAAKTFAFRLPDFVAHHPYTEVAVLHRLETGLPAGRVLGGSSPFLGRYLRHRYVALPDAFGAEVTQPALYYARLERLARDSGLDYLVIGQLDLRSRPVSLLGPAAPVPWLAPAGGAGNVIVWRVTRRR